MSIEHFPLVQSINLSLQKIVSLPAPEEPLEYPKPGDLPPFEKSVTCDGLKPEVDHSFTPPEKPFVKKYWKHLIGAMVIPFVGIGLYKWLRSE